MAEKSLVWVGSSLRDIQAFPPDARRKAGHELYQVQIGLAPSDWKPMPSIGPGVVEIRLRTQVQHRVFYVAKFAEAIYVLHSFQKTTRKTPSADIELGKRRLGEVMRLRGKSAGGSRET